MTSIGRMLVVLSYADRHALLNAVRALRRQPLRLLLWTLYAAGVVFALLAKAFTPSGVARPTGFLLAASDLWVCGFAFALGAVLCGWNPRWLGVFASRAEALLLTRGDVPGVVLAAYLQMRAVLTAIADGFARFAFVLVLAVPNDAGLAALLGQVCFFAASGAAVMSAALPRALARGALRAALTVCGVALAAAAAYPLAGDALRLAAVPLAARLPEVHPGALLHAIARGDLRALALPLAIASLTTGAFIASARDAVPELYAISIAHLEWRSRRQARNARRDQSPARVRSVRSIAAAGLRGAPAFVWIDLLMFVRRTPRLIVIGAVPLAAAAGAAVALLVRSVPVSGTLLATVPGFTIAITAATTVRLAPALRMPLFWLGGTPLAARLAAWALGPFLRDALLLTCAVAGYVAISGHRATASIVLAGLLGLLAVSRAVGLAVFSIFPNALDQRGPAVMLRTLLTVALFIPLVIAALAGGWLLHPPFAGAVLSATAIAFAESAALVFFAASRLSGRVDRLAAAAAAA